ncbi:Folic acid synthesis protein fol1-like protein 2 [Botrytis cinerea]
MESQADLSNTSTIPSENHLSVLSMACNYNSFGWMSSWELSKAREEPIAVIAVKDLQLQVLAGADGWNQTPCSEQPALISVFVSLRRPFKKASEDDDIAGDTIHYGLIKIAIIDAVKAYHLNSAAPDFPTELSMKSICVSIISHLTNRKIVAGKKINWSAVRIMLPKSSLRGAGASLTAQMIYKEPSLEDQEAGDSRRLGLTGESCTLRLHDLIVPTIIGLLPKERTMKQNVTIEESSFQTLEALAEHIITNIIRHSLIPTIMKLSFSKDGLDELADDYKYVPWKETRVFKLCPIVKIKLEKPGIYIDTTPGVEMSMDMRPSCDSAYFNLWDGYKRLRLCPRPLIGTLADWIAQEHPKLNGGTLSSLGPQDTKEITAQPGEHLEHPQDGESSRLDLNQKLDGSRTDTSKYNDTAEGTVAPPKEIPESLKFGEPSLFRDFDRKLKTLQGNITRLRKTTGEIMAKPRELNDRESSTLVEIGQELDSFREDVGDYQKRIQEMAIQ